MAISIILNGVETPVTKQQLFVMAKMGSITPDTEIIVNGVRATAGKVKDIVFGDGSEVHEKQENSRKHRDESPAVTYEILLHGISTTVTKQQLFSLAAQGIIEPNTPVTINGKLSTAGMVDGIQFGIVVVGNARQFEQRQSQKQGEGSEPQGIQIPANAMMLASPAKRLLGCIYNMLFLLGICLLTVIIAVVEHRLGTSKNSFDEPKSVIPALQNADVSLTNNRDEVTNRGTDLSYSPGSTVLSRSLTVYSPSSMRWILFNIILYFILRDKKLTLFLLFATSPIDIVLLLSGIWSILRFDMSFYSFLEWVLCAVVPVTFQIGILVILFLKKDYILCEFLAYLKIIYILILLILVSIINLNRWVAPVFLENGLLFYTAFCVITEYYWMKSTSFGKSKLGLVVVDSKTMQPLGYGYMVAREIFGKMLSLCFFNLGYFWILIDKERQGWHDKLVDSCVVNVKPTMEPERQSLWNMDDLLSYVKAKHPIAILSCAYFLYIFLLGVGGYIIGRFF